MTQNQIFKKTMPFVWLKLLLELITFGLSAALFALMLGLLWLLDGLFWQFLFPLWMIATVGIHFLIVRYIGYLVRAGHVAVVAEAVTTGAIPEQQVTYGKNMVAERFLAANTFFAISALVDRSVKQLQRTFDRVGGFVFGAIPGAKLFMSFVKLFLRVSFKYIDECCLGWVFHNKEQGAFKSALDGVVIYAQNWKTLLKSALKTSVLVIVVTVVISALSFFLLGRFLLFIGDGGFNDSLWGLAAFFFAVFLAFAFKRAFIDSYMMVRMMTSYMQVAPSTEITFDLYGKLSALSKSFRELLQKAEDEGSVPPDAQTETQEAIEPELLALPAAPQEVSLSELSDNLSRKVQFLFKKPENADLAPPPFQAPLPTAKEAAAPRATQPVGKSSRTSVTVRPQGEAVPAPPSFQVVPAKAMASAIPVSVVKGAEKDASRVLISVRQDTAASERGPLRVTAQTTSVSVKATATKTESEDESGKPSVTVRPQPGKAPQTVFCSCGHLNKAGTRLCGKCGIPLD